AVSPSSTPSRLSGEGTTEASGSTGLAVGDGDSRWGGGSPPPRAMAAMVPATARSATPPTTAGHSLRGRGSDDDAGAVPLSRSPTAVAACTVVAPAGGPAATGGAVTRGRSTVASSGSTVKSGTSRALPRSIVRSPSDPACGTLPSGAPATGGRC